MTVEQWDWEDDWWQERGRRVFASPWIDPAEVTDNRLCCVSVEAVADAMRTGEDEPGRALADDLLPVGCGAGAAWHNRRQSRPIWGMHLAHTHARREYS